MSGGPATRVVRGIIHCHSDISYDCKTPLPALCAKLESEGFQFVALTEHDRGVRDETYAQFARRCAEVSSERFLALVPAVEREMVVQTGIILRATCKTVIAR